MKKRVAIEDSLKNVRDFLQREGYQVSSLEQNKNNLDNYDAVIVSGQDENFMGMRDTLTKASVIDATGKTPMQVYDQLKRDLR
ncbi:hypothetical protein L21TH_0270 [Caldisalinibacter kiritimatiensis]|uniref:YkuS family protein n=1 Tax=Caldisalinibacter kiritimatiensis TaxID=1304284 RepID=R1CYK9_9FIRM|nr:YkuS family protein [Caldisalinibacter kiritimatiensis]EOD01664.1 hypothetical protein L21TH_0270 [Caldisalinibacter kiritimatiensis]